MTKQVTTNTSHFAITLISMAPLPKSSDVLEAFRVRARSMPSDTWRESPKHYCERRNSDVTGSPAWGSAWHPCDCLSLGLISGLGASSASILMARAAPVHDDRSPRAAAAAGGGDRAELVDGAAVGS